MNTNDYLKTKKKLNVLQVSKICLVLMVLFLTGNLLAQTPELVPDSPLEPKELTEYNGELYFNAEADDGNEWLWRTNGASTESLIPDFYPAGLPGHQPRQLTVFNGQLIMSGMIFVDNYIFYTGLMGYDDGLTSIKLINENGDSDPRGFTELDGGLIFNADDGNSGRELWITDGTEDGTQLLKNINGGPDDSNPLRFFEYNEKLLFTADDGSSGTELWVTDGTSNGTNLVKDIRPGFASSGLYGFTLFDGKVYFRAGDGSSGIEPWVTDGTENGTYMLKDINSGSSHSYPGQFTAYDGKLYFAADDGDNGKELWVTDGTEAGTELFKDINSGSEDSSPQSLAEYNGQLYFGAKDGSGYGLWVTDGSDAGTIKVKGTSSSPQTLFTYDDRLYFQAKDENGGQLWISDGTTSGTEVIAPDIAPNESPIYVGENPAQRSEYLIVDETLYFTADYDGDGLKLYELTTNHLDVEDYDKNELILYPNPVKDVLHIETKAENIQQIELFSITGQRLKTWEGQSEIDLSPFSEGNYFVKISTGDDKTVTKQIIKK